MTRRKRKVAWIVLTAAGAVLTALALNRFRRGVDRNTIQRRFWNPVYDRLATWYDAVDWLTFNTTHRLRLRALGHLSPPGSRVLEIGFGSGKLHAQLAGQYQMAGLDLAPGMQRLTQRRLAAHSLTSDLRTGSVYAIPWPDASFDAVLSTFAFSAFPDADAAMDEMIRVVKPGGKVIIVDAGESKGGNLMARWLANLWELLGDYMRDEVPLMEARGLQVKREEYGPWNCIHVVVGTRPSLG